MEWVNRTINVFNVWVVCGEVYTLECNINWKIFSCQIFRNVLVKIGFREISQKFSGVSVAEFTVRFCSRFPFFGSCLCAVQGHPQDRAVKAKGSKTGIFGVQKLVSGSLT